MKAKKLFWTLAAAFAALSMSVAFSSCEKKEPTPSGDDDDEDEVVVESQPDGIMSPGAGKTTLVVYIPNSACTDAVPYVIGSLPGDGNWTNVEALKMTRCEGKQEWWQVTTEALNAENATNFKFRMDDGANGWKYEPKQTYAEYDAELLAIKDGEDKNLVAIADCSDKVIFIKCGKWATPCIETNKAGKATIVATIAGVPEGYTVGVVGNFAEASWDLAAGVKAMTKGEGDKYTLEFDAPEAFEFKILLSQDGTTWDYEVGQKSGDNFALDIDLKSEVEIKELKGI